MLTIKYNKKHIIGVFKAAYAFASEFDPEVNDGLEITQDHLFVDWISDMDLIRKPDVQLNHYNTQFHAEVPAHEFKKLWSSKVSTLGDLAELIEKYSRPIPLAGFKFGGKYCETGTILRFLTLKMQAGAPAGLKIRPSTPFSQMFNQPEIGHFSELMGFLPDAIKPPKRVYHWKILPRVLRLRYVVYTTFAAAAVLFGIYSFFWGVKFQALWAGLLFLLILVFLKFDKKVKPQSHWIFKGNRNLRELVKRESRKETPYWKNILTTQS